MRNLRLKAMLFGAMLFSALNVQAADYSEIYVFGDSLSDAGNLQAVLQDPTIPERFTNGPVTMEIVAASLGLSLSNSYHLLGGALPFGNNYAIAGATSLDEDGNEATPDINLPTQVNSFLQIHAGVAPSDALYVVFIGGNDVRAARDIRAASIFEKGEALQQARQAAKARVDAGVASEKAQIMKLIASGAQHILVVSAPDLGNVPETTITIEALTQLATKPSEVRKAGRLDEFTTRMSHRYNRKLAKSVRQLERETGLDILEYDVLGFAAEEMEEAEELGYTNITDPCIYVFTQAGTPNLECIASAASFPTQISFFFWDEVHPSAMAHLHSAYAMLEVILAD